MVSFFAYMSMLFTFFPLNGESKIGHYESQMIHNVPTYHNSWAFFLKNR